MTQYLGSQGIRALVEKNVDTFRVYDQYLVGGLSQVHNSILISRRSVLHLSLEVPVASRDPGYLVARDKLDLVVVQT